MPWKASLQIFVLLAIGGFVLTILNEFLSGFWHLLALVIITVALLGLRRNRRSAKK